MVSCTVADNVVSRCSKIRRAADKMDICSIYSQFPADLLDQSSASDSEKCSWLECQACNDSLVLWWDYPSIPAVAHTQLRFSSRSKGVNRSESKPAVRSPVVSWPRIRRQKGLVMVSYKYISTERRPSM